MTYPIKTRTWLSPRAPGVRQVIGVPPPAPVGNQEDHHEEHGAHEAVQLLADVPLDENVAQR